MRSRFAVLSSLVAIAAFVLPAAAQIDSVPSPAAVGDTSRVSSASEPAVRVAIPIESIPAPTSDHHLPGAVGFGALIGATAKRATRRKTGAKREVPLYLDSDAHVMRDGDDGKKVNTVIKGAVLVDDTDLTDDEIDELTALRVIRPATNDEIERLERKDADAERTDLIRTQTSEIEQLRARQESERADLEAKSPNDEQRSIQSDRHATQMTKLQEKHVAALNKIDQA